MNSQTIEEGLPRMPEIMIDTLSCLNCGHSNGSYPHICQPIKMTCWDGKFQPFSVGSITYNWCSEWPRKE